MARGRARESPGSDAISAEARAILRPRPLAMTMSWEPQAPPTGRRSVSAWPSPGQPADAPTGMRISRLYSKCLTGFTNSWGTRFRPRLRRPALPRDPVQRGAPLHPDLLPARWWLLDERRTLVF